MPYSIKVYNDQAIFNLTSTKVLGNLYGGSFTSGTSVGWSTGNPSGPTINFTSTTPNTNVSNLTASSAAAPVISVSDGGMVLSETAAVTFKPLAAGQSLTLAGLTFTSGATGTTAAQLATAFASITNGTAGTAINTTKTLNDGAGGIFTSGTATGWGSGAATGAAVTFTSSSANTNVTNLTSTVAEGTSAPAIVTTEGVASTSNETAAVTFKPLAAGQSLTMAGLTFTSGTAGTTANQLASAFASITNGTAGTAINTAKTLNDLAGGTFTAGTATGWGSGTASGAAVTFTSSSVNTNVSNLTSTLSITESVPTITVTDGNSSASTESAAVSFSAMTAGQTLSIAGLTFTAGTTGATAAQVANAFANLAVGTTANHANNIPFIYDSAYVVTPGTFTTATSLSGYIDKPIDGNSYTFLATGTFTVASGSANTTIAAIKGTITAMKVFVNGALAEEISYGTNFSTSMFGVTSSSSPPSAATLSTQRAQAVLQYDSLFQVINTGATFTGSSATSGGADQVIGGTGNDTFTGNTGNDYFNGSAGVDTAVYRGNRSSYTVITTTTTDRSDPNGVNQLTGVLVNDGTVARDGTDTLINVERLQFANMKLAIDTGLTQSAGQTALLLGAVLPGQLVFDSSKQALLGSVMSLFDQGFTLKQLSGAVLRLPIWDALTGKAAPTNTDIANYLLTNVNNGLAPSASALTTAVTALNTEAVQGEWLASIAAASANQTHINLVGLQTTGLTYL